MLDKPAIFLRRAGQEAGHINQRDNRNVKTIAKPHETRRLAAGIAVQHARQHHGLIGNKAHCAPFHAAETDDNVLGKIGLDFEKIALIYHFQNQFAHVIRHVGVFRHQRVERRLHAVAQVKCRTLRYAGAIAQRQKVNEPTQLVQRLDIIVKRTIGDR